MMEFNNMAQHSNGDPFTNIIPMNDIDIGRESLPLLELSTSFGRESLGILKIGCDINNHLINPSQFNNFEMSTNIFDQAFLSSHCDSASSLKSSNFSLKFNGHDQISPINIFDFPSSFHFPHKTNILDDGFLCPTAMNGKHSLEYRSRFNSLPVFINNNRVEKVNQSIHRASEGYQINCDIVEEEGSEFNDSVFIEARHLATKFNDEGTKDGFILDDTDPPELINGDLDSMNNSVEERIKYDSEEVFKKIDKLLPASGFQQLHEKLDHLTLEQMKLKNGNLSKDSIDTLSGEQSCNPRQKVEANGKGDNISVKDTTIQQQELLAKEPEQSPSKEINEPSMKFKTNTKFDTVCNVEHKTQTECTKLNRKEQDKILQALSIILSKDNRTEKEAHEGQCLLNTLSEILSSNTKVKCSYVDNSNKSKDENKELHNISTKSQESSHLNNSTTENHGNSRKHSNSFSFPNKALRTKLTAGVVRSPSFDGSKTKNSVSSEGSSVDIRNFSGDNPVVNLKLKKGSQPAVRRGPMKATVPMANINKPLIKGTPTKANQIMPKLKSRISTPIRDIQIKPMAQSTPDNKRNDSSSSMELTNIRSLSSNTQDKSNHSSSVTSVSSYRDSSLSKSRPHVSQLPRRNSVSEGRKSSTPDVKRSSSMKESSLMKAMNKIRQNISVSKAPLRDSSNISSRESFNTSGKIITTPKRVVRAVGKENTSAVC